MTATPRQDTEKLARMVHSAVAALSPSAVNALIAHPDAVRAALAATGEVLAKERSGSVERGEVETIGPIEEPSRSPEEVRRLVEAHTTPYEPDEEVLNSNEVAARLGLESRQSVHDWLCKGRIVGWQNAKRDHVFPARQFDERDRPIEGLDEIVALFGSAHRAWGWLTTPEAALDEEEPLTALGRGERDWVVDAAKGYLQGDFA